MVGVRVKHGRGAGEPPFYVREIESAHDLYLPKDSAELSTVRFRKFREDSELDPAGRN